MTGQRAKGVMAQSVVGGGGNGGMTFNGSLSTSSDSTQYTVTLGSNGAKGGTGGVVMVTNSAPIETGIENNTDITQSHAIFAQSVGGGGGSGAITGTITLSADAEDESHSLSFNMSSSGDGGTGSDVTVNNTNTGALTTYTKNSHGIFGQSVGGGGGDADGAVLSLAKLLNNPAPSFSTNYQSSGSLGSGNTGGKVTITNTATIGTQGTGSHGIFAQSVGGGGGSSGSLGNPFKDCSARTNVWDATVALGEATGSGGDGDDVSVTNSGSVSTTGSGSYAIFAQSIGAGGGSMGDASALSLAMQDDGLNEFSVADLALGALGLDGADVSGNGGTVNVTHDSGDLTTEGIGSTAIYAQSVGAGGGKAGTGAIGKGGIVVVGGFKDAAGDGKNVTVDVKEGTIETGTDFKNTDASIVVGSYGVFAQSVGSGGHAGNVNLGANTALFGSGFNMNNDADSKGSGTGGDVTVTSAANLTAYGNNNVGIFAQSVGGGGGIAGEVVKNPTGATIGSNNGDGKAGKVSVLVTGSVSAPGANSYGVFAQSAGGKGTTTSTDAKVAVTVSGSVSGLTTGIFAQSSGDGKGPITATIDEGSQVLHGSDGCQTNSEDCGTGIVIKEGTNNTINNAGLIQLTGDSEPSAGVAIRAVDVPGVTDPSQVAITNTGTIDGWICVGEDDGSQTCQEASQALAQSAAPVATTGASQALAQRTTPVANAGASITLVNEEGGVLNTGDLYEVAEFTNKRRVIPGGAEKVTTLVHTGNLVHTDTGVMEMELNAAVVDSDTMRVRGTADLVGGLEMLVLDIGSPKPVGETVTILTADGGLSDRTPTSFAVKPNIITNYALEFVNQNRIDLSYNINYAGDAVKKATNDNEFSTAKNLQRIYEAGSDGFEELLTDFANLSDAKAYTRALESMGAEVYADNQLTSLYSSMLFGDSLLSCGVRSGDYRFITEGQCGWMRFQARNLNRNGTNQNRGFREDAYQIAGGGQMALGKDWRVGGGMSFEGRVLGEDGGLASSDGWQLQAGAVVKRQFDATLVSLSFSGGYGEFDGERQVLGESTAKGNQDLWLISAQARGEHAFEFGNWYLKPRMDLSVDYVSANSFKESGAGALNLRVQDDDNTYVYLQPAVEVGGEYGFKSGTLLRPRLSVGLTQFLTSTSPSARASFNGAPGGTGSFSTESELDRTYFNFEFGMDIITNANWIVSLDGLGQVSSNTQTFGGGLKLSVPFSF